MLKLKKQHAQTSGVSDGADYDGRHGHEDAAERGHERQLLSLFRRLRGQNALKVHLPRNSSEYLSRTAAWLFKAVQLKKQFVPAKERCRSILPCTGCSTCPATRMFPALSLCCPLCRLSERTGSTATVMGCKFDVNS